MAFNLDGNPRHCEKRSDEAIHSLHGEMDCFASLAMTFPQPPCDDKQVLILPDGQIAQVRHAQIARRVNLPQAARLAAHTRHVAH
jgi:hypothetical protein